jgi:3-phenylpropionate/cinnamic acid dioxygenase small subunit
LAAALAALVAFTTGGVLAALTAAAALRATSMFEARRLRHFPGTLRIRALEADGTIRAEQSYLAIESIVGDAPVVFSAGRSVDEIIATAAGWRFRSRRVVYDHSYIRNSLVFPL